MLQIVRGHRDAQGRSINRTNRASHQRSVDRNMKTPNKMAIGVIGSVLSAVATSGVFLALTCCAGPIVFLSLGLSLASISTFELFASYKWFLLVLTTLFLLLATFQVYKQVRSSACDSTCTSENKKRNRVVLLAVTLIVLSLLIFPFAYEKYLMQVK